MTEEQNIVSREKYEAWVAWGELCDDLQKAWERVNQANKRYNEVVDPGRLD